MKVAWFGTHDFSGHLRNEGFDAVFVPMAQPRVFDWDGVCRETGMEPDVLVYSDRSFPPVFVGVERYPCLTCFYVVDSHIHSWYPIYAHAFDARAVSLRDHLPGYRDPNQPGGTLWLPAFPRDQDRPTPNVEQEWDVVFVGKVDAETTPLRKVFLDELQRLLPGRVHLARGRYAALYPRARIVLNIAERGDLNFRVFEALACGACLLTPRIGHGQDELFPPGECLEVYENLDAVDAAARIEALLADPARRQALAETGYAEIERAHRIRHRAASLAAFLRSDGPQAARDKRLRNPGRIAQVMRALYLHWGEQLKDEEHRRKMFVAAMACKG